MPTVTIPDKICSHCGGNKWIFDPKKNTYRCSKKATESVMKWRKNNQEKWSSYQKQLDEIYKNSDYRKTQFKNYSKSRVNLLTDAYIKDRLYSELDRQFTFSEIPQDLIELKRKQILLTRQIRNHESKN
jgi:hypothetical protein